MVEIYHSERKIENYYWILFVYIYYKNMSLKYVIFI